MIGMFVLLQSNAHKLGCHFAENIPVLLNSFSALVRLYGIFIIWTNIRQ